MKTLYESILGSTKSGKMQVIKDWCEENIAAPYTYIITSDEKIIPGYPGNPINLKNWNGKPIPSCIKFGNFGKGNFFPEDALSELKSEQLPDNCSIFYISGKIGTIPPLRIKAQFGFSINDFCNKLTNIEKLEIECSSLNGRKPIIDLSYTNVKLSDVMNIYVIGDIYKLNITKTPAAKELLKIFNKQEKISEIDLNRGFISKELNEIFKNFPELRFIQVSERKTIEYNQKTDRWYKF